MTERPVIVVDVETSGLDATRHHAVEVAWEHLDTGESGVFIPVHNVGEVLAGAEIEALRVNRYIDRLADQPQDWEHEGAARLAKWLCGSTLAGSNPAFDAAFLTKMFQSRRKVDERLPAWHWHHRLLDLGPYAAGALGLPFNELPGLAGVCELLGVEPGDHTARGDVTATAACFRKLRNLTERRAAA